MGAETTTFQTLKVAQPEFYRAIAWLGEPERVYLPGKEDWIGWLVVASKKRRVDLFRFRHDDLGMTTKVVVLHPSLEGWRNALRDLPGTEEVPS